MFVYNMKNMEKEKEAPCPTLTQYCGNTAKITIAAGGQYEIRIRPNGEVMHNLDDGVWHPMDGDNFIDINSGALTNQELIIRIRDKDDYDNILFKLVNPSIIYVIK
jgi:hypothetical protein